MLVPTTTMLCAEMFIVPMSIDPSANGGVREPSAPKKTRPRPLIARCTPTDTISSTSTDASATGW